MKKSIIHARLVIAFTILVLSGLFAAAQGIDPGSLVIAGGDLEEDNKDVYLQLIELAGGKDKAAFAVIPAASGIPVQSYVRFRKTLISYGIDPARIYLIPIAMVDDDSTASVDESGWNKNTEDLQLAALVRKCSAVWFTGGDQVRITKALFSAEGLKTPVLEAVWEVYHSGGVIGGSSAGAAVMSEIMIGGGSSSGALMHGVITGLTGDDFPENEGVLLTNGLGFFPFGIVDQHFDTRSRIGRLIVAMLYENNPVSLGFGVDENTALIYDGAKKLLRVAGASGVTIVNSSQAKITRSVNPPVIENLLVSRLENGDSYDLTTSHIIPDGVKESTSGNEHYNIENPGQGGVLTGYPHNLAGLLTVSLMDNKGADRIQNLGLTSDSAGFLVTLRKTPGSKGFYTDKPDGEDHYTVVDVSMDIIPVLVSINPLK